MYRLVLIGMPACGKSTTGKNLAKRCHIPFTDGDSLIREQTGKPLHRLIEERGTEGFLALEEEILCSFAPEGGFVLAPGGSAVYSARAMAHLKELGTAVYLKLSCDCIEKRIPDFVARGVVMRGNIRTIRGLYGERVPLYERYADITVDVNTLTTEEIAEKILRELNGK